MRYECVQFEESGDVNGGDLKKQKKGM